MTREETVALRDVRQQIDAKHKHFWRFFWAHAGLKFWLWMDTWRWYKKPVYIYYGNEPFQGFLDKYDYA